MSIEQEIYNKLVEQFGINEICIKKYQNRPSKTWLEVIEAALKLDTSELYGFCGYTRGDSFSRYFRKEFRELMIAKSKRGFKAFFLSLLELKHCSYCKEFKPLSNFNNAYGKTDGLQYICKPCSNADNKVYIKINKDKVALRTKKYRQVNRDRIKEYMVEYRFINKNEIKIQRQGYQKNNMYRYNSYNARRRAAKLKATPKWADLEAIKEIYRTCPEGYHVDHIIPLQGELVCGLHVKNNLQHLSAHDNISKGNRYTIT